MMMMMMMLMMMMIIIILLLLLTEDTLYIQCALGKVSYLHLMPLPPKKKKK